MGKEAGRRSRARKRCCRDESELANWWQVSLKSKRREADTAIAKGRSFPACRIYSSGDEDSSDCGLEASDRGGQRCPGASFVCCCLFHLPTLCLGSHKLTGKNSACSSNRAVLDCQFLWSSAFVFPFAVWARVESLGGTHSQWMCVPLLSDDLRRNVRPLGMLDTFS
jgi:hypothetical protein